MDSNYIQNIRYKLQKRVRRLNSTDYQIFHFTLKQFWGFLNENEVFTGIMDSIEAQYPQVNKEVDKIFSKKQGLVFDTEQENAAACYFVLKRCVASDDRMQEVRIGQIYSHESKYNDILEAFKDIFIEPFYDYVDENLDDQGAILALLRKYKHVCEWFKREDLFKTWENDTGRGEKKLALDLYRYLYEQGIEFYIEPSSKSGEVDLISSQIGENRLLADAKIFNPESSKGKSYLLSGFNQIYTYTSDYNEPFGYLVIFKTCEEDLSFTVEHSAINFPVVTHNGKSIFFVIVDIFPHSKSASKKGPLKTIEISASDLVGKLKMD